MTHEVDWRICLFVVAWLSSAAPSLAEDTVRLAPSSSGGREQVLTGEILDLTGEKLLLRRAGGGEQQIDRKRVAGFETQYNADYLAAKELIAGRDAGAAVAPLLRASRSEPRPWVRRLILQDLMQTYDAQGWLHEAGDVFLRLAGEDAATPAYETAPLAWDAGDAVVRSKAEAWLSQRERPAALLLGASHLLSTTARPQAQQMLGLLARSDEPRIAALAQAQLWRTELLGARLEDVRRWERSTESMPAEAQAGAHYVVADGWSRLDETDTAVLHYLRVPIVHAANSRLAARSLLAAARLLHDADHTDEATALLQELADRYPGMPSASEGRALLESIRAASTQATGAGR